MKERWRSIPGFEGYQISDQGRVQSCRFGTKIGLVFKYYRLITPSFNGTKTHLQIDLVNPEGERRSFALHRILYEVFIGPIPDGMVVDHVDRKSLNNSLSNLRLATPSQNVANSGARNKAGWPKGLRKTKAGNWSVQTSRQGKMVHLGTFKSQQEAVNIFNKYLIETFGDHACLSVANKEIH